MEKMKDYWSMNEATFACLHDSKRTLAFRKAIRNTLKHGDVVLETGAGSGILSMFAVDAGASHVYAVELDKGNIRTLKRTISENGYEGKITIIEGDATKIDIPEKVDVIICEMIATGLIEELQVPVMNHVLKFLKKNGKILLNEYEIFIEAVYSKSKFYNKNFSMIRFELPEMRDMRAAPFSNKSLVRKLNFQARVTSTRLSEVIDLKVVQSGVINAIRLSGNTIFSDKSSFLHSTAYDFPIILPLPETSVSKGEVLKVKISYLLGGGVETLQYTLV